MSAMFIDCRPMVAERLTPELLRIVPGLVVNMATPAEDEIRGLLDGFRAALVFHTYIPESVLVACPGLRLVVYLSTGASSYIDMEAAGRRGIVVRNTNGYGDRSVAEHAFALMLAAARNLPAMDRGVRGGVWAKLGGIELSGKTLGVVGLGATGREMARLASSFGMRVIGWSRGGVPAGLDCEAVALDDLLARADVVSLHLAATPGTRGLIDRRRLALMQPGAILVNTARGALIDEQALVAALRAGRPGHAALDVFADEPLTRDHPLAGLPNVTLSAHAAWQTSEALTRLLRTGLETLRDELAKLDRA
jgi:D-3-phosphoglycerate dehydrogenase